MKKPVLFLAVVCIITGNPALGQAGLLKKVSKSVATELLGKPDDSQKKTTIQPEPACACDSADLIINLGGGLQLDYRELSISILDDGRVLAKHIGTDEYYIVKNGIAQGPYKSADPIISEFSASFASDGSDENFILINKPYITKSGEKFLITFDGKKYGPYSKIQSFAVSLSKEKFAAVVIENDLGGDAFGKEIEEEMENAKTDQERLAIAMKYSQEVHEKLFESGESMSIEPELVTNIPDARYDPLTSMGSAMWGKIKYNDILLVTPDKVIDLNGNNIIKIKAELSTTGGNMFINSDNSKYAAYDYGTLKFSDNTFLSEVFNPHLLKAEGKIYLAYMYYSPKRNSILQCRMPF